MSSRAGVRVAVVGVFALLAVFLVVGEGYSQPGRPRIPGPPPGFGGVPTPPTVPRPGGITGISGISGMPGGISGISGISGRMPGGITGIGGGISGLSGAGESVWVCGGCKAELGRGPIKPGYTTCPRCGVRFSNGIAGGGMFAPSTPSMPPPGSPPTFTPSTPPVTTPPPSGPVTDPDLPQRGSTTPSADYTTPPPATTPSYTAPPAGSTESSSSSSDSKKAESKTGSLILKIMIGVFGVLFLLGIVGGAILILSANKGGQTPGKRGRVRSRDWDDD